MLATFKSLRLKRLRTKLSQNFHQYKPSQHLSTTSMLTVLSIQDWPLIFDHRQQSAAIFDHIFNVYFRWTLVIYKSFNQKRGYSLTNRKIHCGKPRMIGHINRISTQFFILVVLRRKVRFISVFRQPILDADLDRPVTEWLLYWWIKNSFYIKVKIWTIWSVYY